jgi:hypothetical protein
VGHEGASRIRLVPTRVGAGVVPPATGREAGERAARQQRGVVDPPPGGSARYHPAAARAGGERGAIALAGRGESAGEREGVTAS